MNSSLKKYLNPYIVKTLLLIRRIAFVIILFSLGNIQALVAQDARASTDTNTLSHALRKGKFDLNLRFYYMHTNNEGDLTDYYAYAFGGGMKYETGSFKRFSMGIGGFFTWNIGSSDLAKPDPSTGIYNRYEIGQFDMEDPSNKNNIDRLEDFYLKYRFPKTTIIFGKQLISTPFINPQDGRMRPTVEQGLWVDVQSIKKTRIQGGWLTKISPRGTVRWMDMDESIGVFPTGLNTNGTKSNYKGNLSSKGVGIIGGEYSIEPQWKVQAWDFFTENIFNTVMVQTDGEWKTGRNISVIAGLMVIHQDPLNYGGNKDSSKTYFMPGQSSNTISARVGYHLKSARLLLNYTRISGDGRFLFPREWGREPLYTFIKRERNEGYGDVNAVSASLLKDFSKRRIKTEISYGYYVLPGIKNYRLNKYGMPSYQQILFDVQYQFQGFLKGMEMEFLYTYKKQAEATENLKAIINKVNMGHVNFIVNYRL
jgi:outer membrane porin, OprD family